MPVDEVTYPQCKVRLVGTSGNVFSIIGNVTQAIRAQVGQTEALAWQMQAFDCPTYSAVLQLCLRTVVVE